MKIFIDSANIEEIKKANEWGIIDGVTTNPSLIAKENDKNKKQQNIVIKDIVQEIIDIIDGPISVEVISTDTEGMIKDATEISKWSKNIVVKIPMTPDGLRATKILDTKDVKTNVTLVFSVNQALLAAKAGATYVSIFVGRLDDIGHEGVQIVSDTVKIFNLYNMKTQVIAASVRHPLHVIESAKAGAHISTVPFNVIEKMFRHPLTDIGIERFLEDWEASKMDDIKTRGAIKEYRIMKEMIIKELDENVNTTKALSKNLSDIIVNTSKIIIDCYRNGGKIILIGNGGSAADAQHIAAELVGRFKLERSSLPAIALTTNTSILTAIANDYGYDTVFSHQLESLANSKDVLIAITTSGNSQNILKAAESAKLKGIKVIGMTGKTGGKLKDIVDILISVPSDNTPRIQESHITIGHIICGLVEENL